MTAGPAPPPTPFVRRVALAAGVSKHLIDGPRYQSVFGSVRLEANEPLTPVALGRAALMVAPAGAALSHHSAARVWGGVVPESPHTHLVVADQKSRRPRDGLRYYTRSTAALTTFRGLRLTAPAQTFVDLASVLDLVDLVVLGDSLAHAGRLSAAQLLAEVGRATGRGSARAREAAELVRDGVESPMETRVRLMLVFAGLPEPQINLTVRARQGRVSYRIDLPYPDVLIAVEYDGRHHAEDSVQWARDIARREDLEQLGWRFLVLGADDVFVAPWQAVLRVSSALGLRGYDAGLSQPPQLFRRHFPGRPARSRLNRGN